MKIREIYVSAFGKLKDFRLSFDDGMNIVLKQNGFGKTTLCEFIRAMFYGMPFVRSQKLEDPRRKYEPWSGGKYGGTLIFEDGERTVRIERYFGKTLSGDKCTVVDDKTGEAVAYSPSVGEALFGIDRESFTKCIMIPQSFVMPDASKSISEKMSSLCVESENVRCEDAVKRLDEWRAKLYKTGKRGYIDELKAKRNALWERKQNAEESLEKLDRLCSEVEELCALRAESDIELKKALEFQSFYNDGCEIDRLKTRIDELSESVQVDTSERVVFLDGEIKKYIRQRDFYKESIDIENYRKSLQPLIAENQEKQDSLAQSERELAEARFCFKKAPDADLLKAMDIGSVNIAKHEKRSEELKSEVEELRKKKEAVQKPLLNVKGVVLFALLLTIGLVGAAIGAALYFGKTLSGVVPFVVMGTGAAAAIFSAIMLVSLLKKYSVTKKAYDSEVGELELNISIVNGYISEETLAVKEIRDGLTKRLNELGVEGEFNGETVGIISADMVSFRFLTNNVEMKRLDYKSFIDHHGKELTEAAKHDKQSLLMLLDGYDKLVAKIDELKAEKIKAETVTSEQRAAREREIERLSSEYNRRRDEFLAAAKSFPESWLDKKPETIIESVRAKLDNVQASEAEKRAKAEVLRRDTEDVCQIGDELCETDALIEKYTSKLANTYKAMEYLKLAESKLAESYVPGMRSRLKAYLSKCSLFETKASDSGEETCAIALDKDFNLSIEERGAMRSVSSFSKGTEAMTAFFMRLSIMESMYGKELPLLLLDDCFNDLDEKNYEMVKNMLKELSESVQIIYFSCYRE